MSDLILFSVPPDSDDVSDPLVAAPSMAAIKKYVTKQELLPPKGHDFIVLDEESSKVVAWGRVVAGAVKWAEPTAS